MIYGYFTRFHLTRALFVVGVRFKVVIANLNCKIDLPIVLED